MNDIKSKVIEVVKELIDLEVNETSTFNSLDFDDFDYVELVMMIEEEFNLEIPDEDADKFETVQDVIEYVSERC